MNLTVFSVYTERMRFTPWFFACFVFCAHVFGEIAVNVSPLGDDKTADGSSKKPFATLKAAINFALKLPEKGDISLKLSDGTYRISDTILLDGKDWKGRKISIEGSKKTILSGSADIDATKLSEVREASLLSKLPSERTAKIYFLNLKQFGISDYGELKQRGFGTPRDIPEIEAFLNGKRLRLARYPNSGLIKIGKVLDAGQVKSKTNRGFDEPSDDTRVRGATFEYTDARHERWIGAGDAYACGNFSVGWADDEIKIEKIDTKTRTVKLSSPHIYGVMSCLPDPKNPKFGQDLSTRGYFVKNLIEELDKDGEFFIDRKNGIFYIALDSPPSGTLQFSMLSGPIVAIKNVDGLKIKNVRFGPSRGMGVFISRSKNVNIDSCEFSNFGTVALSVNSGTFAKNPPPELANKNSAFKFSSSITLSNCKIHDNAFGGAYIRGGDRRTLTPSGNLVFNCEFYRNSSAGLKYTPSLSIYDVGARVSNCTFRDDPFNTMQFGGNDLIIEKNRFERICLNVSDMGVIYTGRNPSHKGNVIRKNFFSECLAKDGKCTIRGVYIDDGSGGYDIRENIFCRIKSADPDSTNAGIAAIYYHGGHDNTAYKNVFIDCAVGVAHSPWEDEWWLKNINCAAWRHNLKEEVDIESDIYQKKYPQLKNFFKNDRPRVNYLTQNLYFRSSGPLNGNFVYKWNAFLNPSKSVPYDKKNWTPDDVLEYFGDNGVVRSILSQRIGAN